MHLISLLNEDKNSYLSDKQNHIIRYEKNYTYFSIYSNNILHYKRFYFVSLGLSMTLTLLRPNKKKLKEALYRINLTLAECVRKKSKRNKSIKVRAKTM